MSEKMSVEKRRRFWNNRDGASVEADVCSSAPDVYRHFITSCKFTHMEAATVTHTVVCPSPTSVCGPPEAPQTTGFSTETPPKKTR